MGPKTLQKSPHYLRWKKQKKKEKKTAKWSALICLARAICPDTHSERRGNGGRWEQTSLIWNKTCLSWKETIDWQSWCLLVPRTLFTCPTKYPGAKLKSTRVASCESKIFISRRQNFLVGTYLTIVKKAERPGLCSKWDTILTSCVSLGKLLYLLALFL